MGSQIIKRVDYSFFFDDEPLKVSEYLKGANKDILLKTAAFLVNIAMPRSKYQNNQELLRGWFGEKNQEFRTYVATKMSSDYAIPDIISSLKLTELIVQLETNSTNPLSSEEYEINIFKAYLVLNSEQNLLEERNIQNIPPDSEIEEHKIALFIKALYGSSDLLNYDYVSILICQVIKSVEYFKYLESNRNLEMHLSYFLKKHNASSWQDWLNRIIQLIFPMLLNPEKSFHEIELKKDENEQSDIAFINSFALTEDSNFTRKDFIQLRSNPLVKITSNKFMVIFDLFMVEKLFKSIQFQFSLEINKEIPKEFRLKDFRSNHCDNFSERMLLYSILRIVFPKKWFHQSGDMYLENGYTAEPDYYLRFKNKMLLFESKDVVLTGEEKQSGNYFTIKEALKKKFHKVEKNNSIEKKAILQILNNIQRIHDKYYSKMDVDYDLDKVEIYPIIVVHDPQFNCLGVNRLVSKWFEEEKENYSLGELSKRIKNVTIIDIDTLLHHQERLKTRGEFRLEKLISDYHKTWEFDPRFSKSFNQSLDGNTKAHLSFYEFAEKKLDDPNSNGIPKFIINYFKQFLPKE
jgi:hypothetical protein